jgi:hypothetical protein
VASEVEITTGVAVCQDCAMMLANGELGQGDDTADRIHAERIAKRWSVGELVLDCGEDCEGWFSWTECDGCGSTLGGDRHPAAYITR